MEELLLPIRKDRFWAASKLLSENNMSESVNNKKSIVKKYFFRLITKKFIKPPKKFLYIIYVEKMRIWQAFLFRTKYIL